MTKMSGGSYELLIIGFHRDDEGDWVAELSCSHSQHVPTDDVPITRLPSEGGEAACWAHLLCPECGAVLDGGQHRQGCRFDDVP